MEGEGLTDQLGACHSANLDLGGGGTSSSGQLHMKGPSITSQHIRATANDSQHNESQEEEEEHGDAKFQLLDAALKHVVPFTCAQIQPNWVSLAPKFNSTAVVSMRCTA
jgi:hypothetical protein